MKLLYFLLLILFIKLNHWCYCPLQAQWATRVVDYQFGYSQTVGHSSEFFPANVLGPVANAISPRSPASSPKDVCSIGKGGFITFQFEREIINEPGPDFIVFENAFFYGNNLVFDEWILVSVSTDGNQWHTFPFDSLSGIGLAGRTPTAATGSNYFDPMTSGGDAFDLEDIGLTKIKYIRLSDATKWQGPDRLAAEVDAVLALHQVTGLEATALTSQPQPVYYLTQQNEIIIDAAIQWSELKLINSSGGVAFQIKHSARANNDPSIELPSIATGVYFACIYRLNELIDSRKLIIGE